ncbi:MAG: PTS sugar transporter subunit IIA [Candidatus Goldiibacteriota bacterium]|jgi:mannose/fructose/sorbose-specific phosphotransferase system IIA component
MVGIIIISHSTLAESLKTTVSLIVGENENVRTIGLMKNDRMEDFAARLKKTVEDADKGDGVLILADMFGGTPCNTALSLFGTSERVRIITGVNLPIVIEAIMHSGRPVDELGKLIMERRDKSIIDAKAIFKNRG